MIAGKTRSFLNAEACTLGGDLLEVIVNASGDVRESKTWEPCVVIGQDPLVVPKPHCFSIGTTMCKFAER